MTRKMSDRKESTMQSFKVIIENGMGNRFTKTYTANRKASVYSQVNCELSLLHDHHAYRIVGIICGKAARNECETMN